MSCLHDTLAPPASMQQYNLPNVVRTNEPGYGARSPTTEVTSRLEHIIVTAVVLAYSSSGLRGRRRTCLTILQRGWSANFKMVRYVLLRPLRPEILAAKTTAVTIICSRREVTSVVGLYLREKSIGSAQCNLELASRLLRY
jgi:hypothetical protein